MKHVKSIPELYTYANVTRVLAFDDFDVMHFSEFAQTTKTMMPPHRRDFYTIIFFKDQKAGQISINEHRHHSLTNTILFQGPAHVFSFVRDPLVEGSILLFQKSFLLPYIEETSLAFPFFNVLNHNFFYLNPPEQESFQQILSMLHREQKHSNVVKPLLVALLEKSKLLYYTYGNEERFLSKKIRLVRKYKHLIHNHFINHKNVDYYASLLHITPNYLNEVVKSETGISAKKHITKRVLLEAKNLLLYSALDIAEIGHLLQFSEPTHFTKFFKKETNLTPKAFQENYQKP